MPSSNLDLFSENESILLGHPWIRSCPGSCKTNGNIKILCGRITVIGRISTNELKQRGRIKINIERQDVLMSSIAR